MHRCKCGNWNNVLWSDEKKVYLFGCDGKAFVRRPRNAEFDPRCTQTIKHGGGSIMLWGYFSAAGVGPIYWIQDKMCATDYLHILNTVMLPYAEEYVPLKWEFMHDNDPRHVSKLVKTWCQSKNICAMDWPSNWPDLNPIEHLRGVLKKSTGGQKWRNKHELLRKVQEAWYSISGTTCTNLLAPCCENVRRWLKW